VSLRMLELLRENAGELAIETRKADAAKLSADDGEFDVVFSNDFMGHFPNWPELLREQARACRAGGQVIFTTSCAEHRETVRQWSGSEFHYGHSPDWGSGMPYWAEVSKAELMRAGVEAGLVLDSVYPIRFFSPSFLFGRAMGNADYETFQKELRRRLAGSEEVMKFFAWLEVTALQRLPVGLSFMILVVMRKPLP
jgi:SAM-dependent methyltransferase